ncbi:hypothetical protein R3P38DRAFT_2522550, partial [Favolaschia claudopus]
RLHSAIMELKPKPPPTTDKKTTFWNGYMALANEYDKEFLQKYGTDLDTSLIFAGLFSAVTSAFIIQIQPEFESTPHPLTVIAQSLLYVSLGSTLLAALLAVLGKQWLMYYSAAGERGTIETRGLERQRKLDGLKKWKFEVIMQAFPLLLQFGLFLFAAALSVYLWKIHHVLANIVLGITSGGAIAYVALLSSAILFKDSPFQTPLAQFLRAITPKLQYRSWPFYWFCRRFLRRISLRVFKIMKCIKEIYSFVISLLKDIPSRFTLQQTATVSWVLESSTDPTLLTQAISISTDLQWPLLPWPLEKNLTPWVQPTIQLFLNCFEYESHMCTHFLNRLRDGMDYSATQIAQACIIMQCFSPNPYADDPFPRYLQVPEDFQQILTPELATVLGLISNYKSPDLMEILIQPCQLIFNQPWLLRGLHFTLMKLEFSQFAYNTMTYLKHLVAELDSNHSLTCSVFAEYLFVVYFHLVDGNISSHDLAVMDKSAYMILLYGEILKTMPSRLKSEEIDMQLTADILKLTTQLASNCTGKKEWEKQWEQRQTAAYGFCRALPQTDGWIQVISTPGLLQHGSKWQEPDFHPDAASWIYNALRSIPSPINGQGECDYTIASNISNILYALYYNGLPPPVDNLQVILQILSLADPISSSAALLLLQRNIFGWYTQLECGPKLQDHSVWALLSTFAVQQCRSLSRSIWNYVDLAYLLLAIPEWRPHIEKELCSWIHIFPDIWTMSIYDNVNMRKLQKQYRENYNVVLKTIWVPHLSISTHSHSEEAIALVCVALSEFWASFDLAMPLEPNCLFSWLQCSNSAIMAVAGRLQKIPQASQLTQEVIIPLQKTLFRIVEQIQALPSETTTPILEVCAEIVKDLATGMLQTGIRNLYDIRNQIEDKIKDARNFHSQDLE